MTIHALHLPCIFLWLLYLCRHLHCRAFLPAQTSGFICSQLIHLPSSAMRVIGGTYRSRRLNAPRGLATRPTSDRLRETLFNVISPRIAGTVFADLYAGSGAVGIEALSRGASMVYFVDQAPPAVAAIRGNLAALGVRSGFRVEPISVAAALRRMGEPRAGSGTGAPCGIIFMDPPYAAAADYARTLDLIGRDVFALLEPDGIVIVEHSRLALAEGYGRLERYRVLEQGDASLSFYRIKEDQSR